jgi:hypothetical protein
MTMTVANPDRRNVRVLFMVNFYLTQRRFIQEITQKSPNNVGVSFINKKAHVRRLYEPEAFHLFLSNIITIFKYPL